MFTTRYEVNTSSELLEFYRLVNECKRSSDWKSNAASNWNLVWRVSGSELLALWKGRKPRSPSPRPSPRGRGKYQARLSPIGRTRKLVARPPWLPLLWGEGRGEGERGRRTDAAAQNVSGPRATEPQFLAALSARSFCGLLLGRLSLCVLSHDLLVRFATTAGASNIIAGRHKFLVLPGELELRNSYATDRKRQGGGVSRRNRQVGQAPFTACPLLRGKRDYPGWLTG